MRSIPRNPPKPIWQTFVCQLASIPGPLNKPLTDFCLSIFVSQTWGPLTDFCLSNCSTGKGASGGVPSCYGCRWQTFVCQIWSTGSDVGCHWQTFVCQIWSTGGGMLPLTDFCLSNLIHPPRLFKNYIKIHRFWTLLGLPRKYLFFGPKNLILATHPEFAKFVSKSMDSKHFWADPGKICFSRSNTGFWQPSQN